MNSRQKGPKLTWHFKQKPEVEWQPELAEPAGVRGSRLCVQAAGLGRGQNTAGLRSRGHSLALALALPSPGRSWQGSGPALQCPEDQVVAEPGAAVRCSWDKHSPRQPLELLSRTRRPLSSNPSQKRCADTAAHHGKFVLFDFTDKILLPNPRWKQEWN